MSAKLVLRIGWAVILTILAGSAALPSRRFSPPLYEELAANNRRGEGHRTSAVLCMIPLGFREARATPAAWYRPARRPPGRPESRSQEYAPVFPQYYFGQIFEAGISPGQSRTAPI